MTLQVRLQACIRNGLIYLFISQSYDLGMGLRPSILRLGGVCILIVKVRLAPFKKQPPNYSSWLHHQNLWNSMPDWRWFCRDPFRRLNPTTTLHKVNFSMCFSGSVLFWREIHLASYRRFREHFDGNYPPGNQHIPPGEQEYHLQRCLGKKIC